jgi:hypothetical protein
MKGNPLTCYLAEAEGSVVDPTKSGDSARARPKPAQDTNQEDGSYFRTHRLMGEPVDPLA